MKERSTYHGLVKFGMIQNVVSAFQVSFQRVIQGDYILDRRHGENVLPNFEQHHRMQAYQLTL